MMRDDSQYHAPTNKPQRDSVEQVESLLTLLQQWPAEEPPMNLVERTMARIAAAAPHPASTQDEAHQQAPRLHDPKGPGS